MTYLKRKIDRFLEEWKKLPDHAPLVVRGAGQVGKTESVLHFAELYYADIVYIDFAEEPEYKQICEDGYGVDMVIRNISRIDPAKKFERGKTLIIFDGLQDFPEICASLESFKKDGRYDVICVGSVLGRPLRRTESGGAGYTTDYEMASLDFEEFLWAKGYDQTVTQDMLAHMKEGAPFSRLEMSLYSGMFQDYCILGGMPAVVRMYTESGSFSGVLRAQRLVIADYMEDIRKYAEGFDRTRILNIFNQVPVQLEKKNRKFQISKVAKDARSKDYREAIAWLEGAGIINVCRCLNYPGLPLRGNFDETKYKIYLQDSGLLASMLDGGIRENLLADKNPGVRKGALYENIIGEALAKSGYPLYYYRKENSSLEEEFFVRARKDLVPVEVKAANGTAKYLQSLIQNEQYPDISYGIRFTSGNIESGGNIFSFPYFCAFLLRQYLQ